MPFAEDGDLSRLLRRGEERLNIEFVNRENLVREANGSYYICQYLAQEVCLDNDVTDSADDVRPLSFDVASIRRQLVTELEVRFRPYLVAFLKASGPGTNDRLPFSALLALIAAIPTATITFDELLGHAGRYGTMISTIKHRVSDVILTSVETGRFAKYVYFDQDADTFSIEDPIFRYFLTFHDFESVLARAGLTEEHKAEILRLSGLVRDHYGSRIAATQPAITRQTVVVCYSHSDRRWLEELQTVLKPLVLQHDLVLWADTRIEPGQSWRDEIGKALQRAKVAILLVSPPFLASDFILHQELPTLLERASRGGLRILWIPITSSAYRMTALSKYQAAIDPSRPLDTLPKSRRNQLLVDLAEKVQTFLDAPDHL
jgi:hypothetical protein